MKPGTPEVEAGKGLSGAQRPHFPAWQGHGLVTACFYIFHYLFVDRVSLCNPG